MSDPHQMRPSRPKITETDFAIIEWHPPDFIHVESKPLAHTTEQAREIVDFVARVRAEEGKKVRLLVDMRAIRGISRDARLLYQGEEHAANVVGAALLVDSGVSRVIGNFVLGLNVSPAPVRLFTTEQDARAWLESLSDE